MNITKCSFIWYIVIKDLKDSCLKITFIKKLKLEAGKKENYIKNRDKLYLIIFKITF